MKKFLAWLVTLCVMLPCFSAWKFNPHTGKLDYYEAAGSGTAADTSTDTTNFDNNLSSADDTVQKALDTIDNLSIGAGAGDVTDVGDCTGGACLDGSSDGGTYIRLYDGDSHYGQFTVPNISGNIVWTLPAATGTLIYGSDVPANETDPQVGTLTNTKWCTTDGSTITCNVDPVVNTDAQDLSLDGNTLSLTGDATTVDLSGYLDNTDAQDLSLNVNTLSLTGDASTVDLSGYLDNTDDQTCAEVSGCVEGAITGISGESIFDLSDVSVDPNADRLAFWDDDPGTLTWVDPATYLDNTDAQDLSLTGNTLSLTGDGTSVDLSGYLDDTDTVLSQEQVEDYAGAMVTGNTETLITVTYEDIDGTIDFVVDNNLANYSNATSGFLTSESDPNALLTVGTDNVKDTHIDWGTGATQVSADDVPDGATYAIPTLTQESNWDTAYGWGNHASQNYLDKDTDPYVASESDPQVGAVSVANNFCIADGDSVECSVTKSAGTDITADLEEETHASEHAVSAADTVFPADPNADKYLMWDDDPGTLVFTDVSVAESDTLDTVTGRGASTANDLTLNGQILFQTDKAVILDTYTDEGINAAIDALGAEGGAVIIPEGSDTVNAVITIDYNNTSLIGLGYGSIINAVTTAANIINLNAADFTLIKNLTLIGNDGGAAAVDGITDGGLISTDGVIDGIYMNGTDRYGVYFSNASSIYNKVVNSTIYDTDSEGIFAAANGLIIANNIVAATSTGIETDGGYNIIIGNLADQNVGRGIEPGTTSAVVGNIARSNTQYGFICTSTSSNLVGNHANNNTYDGYYTVSDYGSLVGNIAYLNGNTYYDYRLVGADYGVVSSNVAYSNGGDAEAGFFIDDSDYNVIIGNNTSASHEVAGLLLDTDAIGNVVIGNYFHEGITDNGTNNIIIQADPANNQWIVWDRFKLDSTKGAFLQIPSANDPSTTTEGDLAYDANNEMLEAYDGAASYIIAGKLKTVTRAIFNPDEIQVTEDAVPILCVEDEWAPFGITLVDVGIKTNASSTYSVNFEEWTSPTDGAPSTIETVATSTSTEAEDDGTLTDAAIAAGSIIYVDLPTTDINMLTVWITYYINPGN